MIIIISIISIDICLQFPKLLHSRYGLFKSGHIKNDYTNLRISQLFSKSSVIVEKREVIALANLLWTDTG